MEDDLQWKTTFDERRHPMEDNLRWKTTLDGRRSWMEDSLQRKTIFDGRRPLMEDDLQGKTTFDGRRPSVEDNLLWKTTIDRPLMEGRTVPQYHIMVLGETSKVPGHPAINTCYCLCTCVHLEYCTLNLFCCVLHHTSYNPPH